MAGDSSWSMCYRIQYNPKMEDAGLGIPIDWHVTLRTEMQVPLKHWEKSGFSALPCDRDYSVKIDTLLWLFGALTKLFLAYCLYIRVIFKECQRKWRCIAMHKFTGILWRWRYETSSGISPTGWAVTMAKRHITINIRAPRVWTSVGLQPAYSPGLLWFLKCILYSDLAMAVLDI